MLLTALLLPLAVSSAVIQERDTAETATSAIVVDKLEPRYRKTANRNRYKLGRKCVLPSQHGSLSKLI